MKILVIGGTGFISGRLVRRLLDAGHRVSILTRGHRPFSKEIAGAERLVGDRSVKASFDSAVGGRTFDAVFDMVAYTAEESTLATELLRGKTGRFIHCSTVSVYMVSDQVECPIAEDQARAPLMPYDCRNPFGMTYGIQKRECEDVLWQAHDERLFPVSMLRPTFVSGPEDPARRDAFWIQRMLDGRPLLVPGDGETRFQEVYVEDVARAFAALLDHEMSIGQAYNIAGEETFTLNEYLAALGEVLGLAPELVHVPMDLFDAQPFSMHPHGDVFTFNTRRTAIFSLERTMRDLGYRSTPFHEWMTRTVVWLRQQTHDLSFGYERRADELSFIRRYLASALY